VAVDPDVVVPPCDVVTDTPVVVVTGETLLVGLVVVVVAWVLVVRLATVAVGESVVNGWETSPGAAHEPTTMATTMLALKLPNTPHLQPHHLTKHSTSTDPGQPR
jgi:hypothetical protein